MTFVKSMTDSFWEESFVTKDIGKMFKSSGLGHTSIMKILNGYYCRHLNACQVTDECHLMFLGVRREIATTSKYYIFLMGDNIVGVPSWLLPNAERDFV